MNLAKTLFLAYLRYAAKIQLWKIKPKHIIGITGSVGKSSCREAVYSVLKEKYRVKQSRTGNSETGLPLDILGFTGEHSYTFLSWLTILIKVPLKLLQNHEKYDIYIAEMGVDSPFEPKNMSYLLKIFRPDIGILLNVYPVHTEFFSDMASIAKEKGKLITSLPADGVAVLNADDPNVIRFRNKTKARVVTFKMLSDFSYTLGPAAAVGNLFGLSPTDCRNALKRNFQPPPGRLSFFPGINKTVIIDSSYNASPAAVLVLLDILKKQPGKRKIAVLGDMRELGDQAETEHQSVASQAEQDADYVFTFGPLMAKYFPQAKNYLKMSELIAAVKDFLKPGDVVLIKGSQNTIFLETLVEKLLANPEDKDKLCRRGEYWDKKREALLKD